MKFLLIIFILLIGLPMLFMNWALVDDGVLILKSQQISQSLISNPGNLANVFIEKEIGRFRPGYYLFYWLIYLPFGTRVFFYYFFHLLILIGILFLIYKIASFLFEKEVGLWASFLFLISSINIENWYRLGPQEPLMVLFLLLSFWFLLKSHVLSFVFLILAFLTKETSMAFVFPLGFLFLFYGFFSQKTKIKPSFFKNFFLFSFLLGLLIFQIGFSLRTTESYTAHYLLSFGTMISNFKNYLKMLTLSFYPLFPFILFFLFLKKNLKNFWLIFFFLWFLSFLLIQSPWDFILGRYLMPSLIGLVLVISFLLVEIKKKIKILWLKRVFLFFIFILLIVQNLPKDINTISASILNTRFTSSFIKTIAEKAPSGSTVYFNLVESESVLEIVYESGLHLSLFNNRPDLKVSYLEKEVHPASLVVSAFAGENFYATSREAMEKEQTFEKIEEVNFVSPFFEELTLRSFRDLMQGGNNFFTRKGFLTLKKINWEIYQKK